MENLVATTRGLRERREVEVMDEKQRILKTLTDLYDGHPWTDLWIAGVILGLTAEQASAKPAEHLHSIWAQLNHIILWANQDFTPYVTAVSGRTTGFRRLRANRRHF